MKMAISKRRGRAWQRRWQNIRRAELDELRRMPPSLKYRQFAALAADAPLFGRIGIDPGEIAGVRVRWCILRKSPVHG